MSRTLVFAPNTEQGTIKQPAATALLRKKPRRVRSRFHVFAFS